MTASRVSAVWGCAVAALLFAGGAAAQVQPQAWQPPIAPGREVRVHSDGFASPLKGEWRGVERDSARISLGGGALVAVPTMSIARIDENSGRQRARGALIGGIGGMIVGGVALALSEGKGDALTVPVLFAAGAFTGLVFGAPIGFLWAPHRWITHVNPRR